MFCKTASKNSPKNMRFMTPVFAKIHQNLENFFLKSIFIYFGSKIEGGKFSPASILEILYPP